MSRSSRPGPLAIARQTFAWRRLLVAGGGALAIGVLVLDLWTESIGLLIGRLVAIVILALVAFELSEHWPARLPPRVARWAFRIVAVGVTVFAGSHLVYFLTTPGGSEFWRDGSPYYRGFHNLSGLALLFAPWLAMAAVLRQISGEAQRQALAFELERSEFERRETDARLRLLQAQVQPHFLFHTLANVRELVDSGQPQASEVLESLIAYLRAAIPRLDEPATTVAQEMALARAYLEVMHMRMPDRLSFALHAENATLDSRCPPMTLLTLVENAVRHGIDPSEEGGRIEVQVAMSDGHCSAEVLDTGVGLAPGGAPGTGLTNLRERLRLAFGDEAGFQLLPLEPRGTRARVTFPASGKLA